MSNERIAVSKTSSLLCWAVYHVRLNYFGTGPGPTTEQPHLQCGDQRRPHVGAAHARPALQSRRADGDMP